MQEIAQKKATEVAFLLLAEENRTDESKTNLRSVGKSALRGTFFRNLTKACNGVSFVL